ncbi:hypothetical protein CRG49_000860 [Neisseria sp. N95_16]|nr:hypothetical protein CRG49_000860 [Neisseria sp. N95_16]PJO79227.1 hypothetical protein CWC45_00900 [Neisseria sp. N177_16]
MRPSERKNDKQYIEPIWLNSSSTLKTVRPRPLQNPYLWHISSLCAARKLAYLADMSALSALLQL